MLVGFCGIAVPPAICEPLHHVWDGRETLILHPWPRCSKWKIKTIERKLTRWRSFSFKEIKCEKQRTRVRDSLHWLRGSRITHSWKSEGPYYLPNIFGRIDCNFNSFDNLIRQPNWRIIWFVQKRHDNNFFDSIQ
jgi:hypothetical protein